MSEIVVKEISLIEDEQTLINEIYGSGGKPERIDRKDGFIYYVDIQSGVVAAVMTNPYLFTKDYINEMHTKYCIAEINFSTEVFHNFLDAVFRGKATCSKEDKFDLEFGIQLARDRCLEKYYKNLLKIFTVFNEQLSPIMSYITEKQLEASTKINILENKTKIENLIKE
jgi:hypothetical protein